MSLRSRWAPPPKNRNLNETRRLAPKEKEQKMKNHITITNAMLRPGRLGPALAALLLLAAAASPASGQVIPPSTLPYGYSYEEWSAKLWQWQLGRDTNAPASLGDPGICSGPASRVRFPSVHYFPPGTGGIIMRTNDLTIDAETPLFIPIIDTVADNTACPLSAFTSYTAEQLAAFDAPLLSAVSEITCAIDGVAVDGLENPTNSVYNVVSPPFSYTTAENGNALGEIEGEFCIPGGMTIYPAVAQGVYLMVAPFSPGRHTLNAVVLFGPTNAPVLTIEEFGTITVTCDHGRDHDHDGHGR
jgi:hypothetical protein